MIVPAQDSIQEGQELGLPFAVTLEEGPEEALLASADAATDFFQEHAPADVEA